VRRAGADILIAVKWATRAARSRANSPNGALDRPIGVNASIVGDRPTGLGIYALNLISGLAALGERLTVYTSRPDLVRAASATVRPITRAVRPERGALGHLGRLAWAQTALRWHVRQDRARVLLNLTPEGLLASRTKQVTVVHDVLPLRYPEEYPRQQYYFRHYVPRVLRASQAVVVSSESTRCDLVRFYGLPERMLHVVLCGYDERRFSPDLAAVTTAAPTPYALFIGNVMPHKNLLRLVDAFAAVAARVPARLVIRGSGRRQNVRDLTERIEGLGLGERVDWQPYATDAELIALYRGARMLLLPSLYEGFGLPALEAMASGTPVITSNVSSLPEVVGDAALCVDPHDTVGLAAAMERVFMDDGLAGELRARGLARAKCFSWERTAAGVRAVLLAVTSD
jgi:glycosyltransferase involved in cell wall biosynthesis